MKKFVTKMTATVLASVIVVLQLGTAAHATGFLQAKMNTIVGVGIPGAQVSDNGNTAASGVANLATNQPMNANLEYRIGSVTKTFTGGVALQLVGQNRLHLNDTVEAHLPGMLPYGDQITIRMLLQHTSGIPDYWESGPDPLLYSFVNDPAVRAQAWTPAQIVSRVSGEPLMFQPGAQGSYSSTNFVLLGMIIEQVTGHSLQTEIQNRIIAPLHLTNTSFPVTTTALPAGHTQGYTFLFGPDYLPTPGTLTDITNYNPSALWAMGNIVSTNNDLNKYMKALVGGWLLPGWLTTQMKQTVPLNMPGWPVNKIELGLGIWAWKLPCGGKVYGHEGEAPGSNTFSFANNSGTRAITMQDNQMFVDWDDYTNTVSATYDSLWCH